MPWGRLDDEFDDNPKVLRLLDEESELEGFAAVGLWTVTLAWAHRNTRKRGKTPGRLPESLPRHKAGPSLGRRLAAILVKHRLWDEIDDERGGWMVHDFADYLPDDKTRTNKSNAGKKGAQVRWERERARKAAAAEIAAGEVAGETAGGDSTVPSVTSTVLSGDGTVLSVDSSSHGLSHGTTVLPSPCQPIASPGAAPDDATVPPPDSTVPSPADIGPDQHVGSDLGQLAEVLTIDGTLPLGLSKTAPHTHPRSPALTEKEAPPTGVVGVISLAGSATPNGKGAAPRADHYDTPGFAEFWSAYGGKGKPRTAAAAYKRARNRAEAATILAAARAYVASTPDVTFRLNAENWLDEDTWLSTATPPAPRRAAGGYGGPVPVPTAADDLYLRHTRLGTR